VSELVTFGSLYHLGIRSGYLASLSIPATAEEETASSVTGTADIGLYWLKSVKGAAGF